MTVASWLALFGLALLSVGLPSDAWDADLELLDLVEEIPDTFYRFLSLEQDASPSEIKKAYRRLSLVLHPDKNKDENAETQFRQLVAIYEVLKDDERRRRYDDILVNGLPDWRQPVFYYRRVRKMSNGELAFLLFVIVTIGHYAVIWSIYLEKQLDEMLVKKKREKKKKSNAKEEVKYGSVERTDRAQERPHWQDILPLKVSMWIYMSIKHMPQTLQEVQQHYEDYQQMKKRQREEQEEEKKAQQEVATREKRSKVKKPKMDFPIYEPSAEEPNLQSYQQTGSIQEVEEQLDQWLQDQKPARKKASEWSEDDVSLLSRLMGKFPGGTPGRWEKIAHELGRSVTDVTTKVKQAKELTHLSTGLVKLSELKGPSLPARPLPVCDGGMGVASEEQDEEAVAVKRRNRKCAVEADGGDGGRLRSRRQKDFNPDELDEEEGAAAAAQENKNKPEVAVWTQNQQKLLELALQQFPRGSGERWDRIAKVVPGKSKEDCMIRYKMLAELVQKRKQVKS
ncbi:dnaJ homolog subfamily C member 1 [Syngnathoides biaculeatus]|uniref:dnaJ homolog subfamily C member 1 n=1 Tax=Syngnathoides biaculeatus TaxID=300417 RepID=UPI002ADE2C43|nr:dnaJ homolog subfamily C member 1 [Syngnathoides biaculeatus]XP_061696318.1 dnaJ homolog subfamily C member 1 [Syngnathoides biaculeatus]